MRRWCSLRPETWRRTFKRHWKGISRGPCVCLSYLFIKHLGLLSEPKNSWNEWIKKNVHVGVGGAAEKVGGAEHRGGRRGDRYWGVEDRGGVVEDRGGGVEDRGDSDGGHGGAEDIEKKRREKRKERKKWRAWFHSFSFFSVFIFLSSDWFEYELGNPMALYAIIPFMMARNTKNSVGLF